MAEKQRPGKKERIVFPYKKICIEGNEVGRLYFVGTASNIEETMVTVMLSFAKGKFSGFFMAILCSKNPEFSPIDFFVTQGGTLDDVTGKNEMMFGSLRERFPKGCDKMGIIGGVAKNMGAILAKHLPELEKM